MRKIVKDAVIFVLLSCFIIIYSICFGTAQVNGNSMYPTYKDNDFLIVSKLKSIDYGDIVAVNSDKLNKLLCKRVIGLGGDHIVINENGLYRNDILLEESYISEKDWLVYTNSVDVIIPKNRVFVLGDNRNYSTDSRMLGYFDISSVYGVVIFNITKVFGITRQTLVIVTIIAWILLIFTCIFGKKGISKFKD